MGPEVLAVVVGAHEALVALCALEALLARVRAHVALQLVGARERPAAERPLARERPLAGVLPQVGLEVGRLAVHFAAAGHVAHVLPLLAAAVVAVAAVLAVGAAASLAATHVRLDLRLEQCSGSYHLLLHQLLLLLRLW